jgi:ribosomal protein L16 Arg81 hydroxylase
LCTEVGRFVGCQTTSNAYVSFGGNGTFGKHWDTHDVFAIQLIGKKRWQLFAPSFPLPTSSQVSEGLQHTCPSTATLECELEAGDMLYIPRGWWHQVTPFDVGSLHLSVGAYLPTLNDYIMWAAGRFLPLQQSARGGLIDDTDALTKLPELMQQLTQLLQDRRGLNEFKLDLQTREHRSTAFDVNLFLDKTNAVLDSDARVSLSSYYSFGAEPAEIPVNGGRLKLEPLSQAIIGLLGGANSLTIGELSQHLPKTPAQAIRAVILNLASYDVLSISKP